MAASSQGHQDVVQHLLSMRADIEAKDNVIRIGGGRGDGVAICVLLNDECYIFVSN